MNYGQTTEEEGNGGRIGGMSRHYKVGLNNYPLLLSFAIPWQLLRLFVCLSNHRSGCRHQNFFLVVQELRTVTYISEIYELKHTVGTDI
jgi:hypothetical protein